ncbi:MAG TPA: SDR family NAD(P)-dependent oxidoreductase [Acidimicrobiales bacterium]|jgi:NAD(P)-dependent dehydrogenase (short-subunit alcohol dehydrogenase family)|nr:SDR family NAD(P)-dependent oxidoreductase [Acidimicrobiales bacterium]
MKSLDGVHAVVTGAASGIGLALTNRLVTDGARVTMADIEQRALDDAVSGLAALGAPVHGVRCDVTEAASVEALADAAETEFGTVQVVCNNAGVTLSGATWESTLDDWRWLFGVNVWGVVHGVRTFVPRLIESGLVGHVINTGSLAGYLNNPGFGAYNATKHAVIAISETLAADLRAAGHPIGVTVVAPYFVETRLAKSARNRPDELRDVAPVSDFTRAVWSTMAATRSATQSPAEIADATIDAVLSERFAVFPLDSSRAGVRARFEALLAGEVPPQWLP